MEMTFHLHTKLQANMNWDLADGFRRSTGMNDLAFPNATDDVILQLPIECNNVLVREIPVPATATVRDVYKLIGNFYDSRISEEDRRVLQQELDDGHDDTSGHIELSLTMADSTYRCLLGEKQHVKCLTVLTDHIVFVIVSSE